MENKINSIERFDPFYVMMTHFMMGIQN